MLAECWLRRVHHLPAPIVCLAEELDGGFQPCWEWVTLWAAQSTLALSTERAPMQKTNSLKRQPWRWPGTDDSASTATVSEHESNLRSRAQRACHIPWRGMCAANVDNQPLVIAVTGQNNEPSSVRQRLAITVNLCGPASPEWTLPFQQPDLSAGRTGRDASPTLTPLNHHLLRNLVELNCITAPLNPRHSRQMMAL